MPGTGWRRSFALSAAAGWILMAAAGVYLARLKGIPAGVAVPVVAAFLVEYLFYLVPGFDGLRLWLADNIPVRLLALSLAASAIAPYLVYSLATGQFNFAALTRLAALVLAISFWYVWQRPSATADLAILALVVAPIVARLFFKQIYTSPIPSIPIYTLGHLMLIRLSVSVMLMLREVEDSGFSFIPPAKDWLIGLRYFAYFVPVGLALSAAMGIIHFKVSWIALARAPFWFLAALWVIGLSEEFLTRGLLQRWITDWTGRPNIALVLASAAFGASHLWFGAFPNWRQAAVAAALGLFCGKAYERAGGIGAAVVTHALAATAFQTLRS